MQMQRVIINLLFFNLKILLQVLHVCYLCCFYGNPLFVRMKWSDGLHEIIKTMMDLVTNNINYKVFIGVSVSRSIVTRFKFETHLP